MEKENKPKKYLVIVDMQNDFIDGALGTKEAQSVVGKIIQKLKTCGNEYEKIIVTKDTHGADYHQTLEGKKLPITHCQIFEHGWKINDQIVIALSEVNRYDDPDNLKVRTITKYTFGTSEIIYALRYEKLNPEDTIEFVGVCTDICVISNALLCRAAFPNNLIYVDSECCAGSTPKAHEAALTVMKSCQIDIL